MVTRLKAAIVPLALIIVAACAGTVFGRIYHGPTLLQLVAGAAALSVLLSTALAAARIPVPVAVGTSMLALAGYLLIVAALTRDAAAGGLGPVYLDALRNSGARILTSTFPVEPAPDTMFLPLLVVWAAGLAGAEIGVRQGRVLLGFAPPVIAYGLALVFVGPNARPWLPLPLIILTVVAMATALTRDDAAAAVWRRLPPSQRLAYRGRGAAIGASALLALLVATVAIGPAVAQLRERPPTDPRSYVTPPQQEEPESNPLGRLSGWAQRPDQQLFAVTMSQPSRIRWVVLNDYDGLNWTPNGEYRSAGSVLPPVQTPGGRATSNVRQQIAVLGLDGLWLPAVEQPTEVTGVRVSYDPATGTLLQPNGVAEGVRYQVVSALPAPADPELASGAAPPSDPAFERFRSVPKRAPEEISKLAATVTDKAQTPYDRALLLESHLSKQYRFAPTAPSGHGFANLKFFLDAPPEQGGGRGTSEQFATAFALMARMIGLPSRVVIGFHAGRGDGGGAYLVRSGDAFAWPEVYLEGQGWVAFDPTPAAGENTPRPPDELTPQAEQQKQAKAQKLDALDSADTPPPPPPEVPRAEPDDPLPVAVRIGVPAVAAVLALVGVPLILLVRRRRLRRRRLSRGTPGQRVTGAWWELLDALSLAGRRPDPHLTAAEVASLAAAPVHGHAGSLPPVDGLAHLVNMVTFAPGLADERHATDAVGAAVAYSAALRARRSWWRRMVWSVDPRPLRWRRRREVAAGPAPPAGTTAVPAAGRRSAAQDGVGSADGFALPSLPVQTESEAARRSTETAAATTKQ